MTRRHVLILIIIVLILLPISIGLNFLYAPVVNTVGGIKYTVRPGASMHTVIDDLYAKNIIKSPILFKLWVKFKKNSQELKAGEYLFKKGASNSKILFQITTGTGFTFHTFTIIPGWTFKQVRQVLLQDPAVKHDTAMLDNAALMKQLGAPETNPEGLFYPDTYYFNEGSSDIALLKRAYNAMQEKLKKLWEQRDASLPYKTSYEALIVASLIEKEAHQHTERPVVSGVIINRLKKDMLLQIDPTVIYGMGDRYMGVIHKADLQADTPYNSYVHKGLPPTPIAMPGWESLQAAVHPQKHEFYFFVVKTPGASVHQFSKTLKEHNEAVIEWRKTKLGFFNKELVERYLNLVIQSALAPFLCHPRESGDPSLKWLADSNEQMNLNMGSRFRGDERQGSSLRGK